MELLRNSKDKKAKKLTKKRVSLFTPLGGHSYGRGHSLHLHSVALAPARRWFSTTSRTTLISSSAHFSDPRERLRSSPTLSRSSDDRLVTRYHVFMAFDVCFGLIVFP